MSGRLRSTDVVVGLLTENTPRMLTQAIRLLRSIRWFGGELANARVVVCGVGPMESRARGTLESLGAEIRVVTRFHPANPAGNRHQLIAGLLDAPQDVLFLFDCDTLIVRDPLPYLNGEVFQAKIAPTPTVTDDVFERLFAYFKLVKPPRAHLAPFNQTLTIPYFNTGVLAIPRNLARTLAPVWRNYNRILADQPELAAPCQRHMHQASLALALAETGVPCEELPVAMNFQINATHVTPPPGFAETDPVIIHYHHLGSEDGFLLPTPYPAAQARIEMFHDRMRAEGFVRQEKPAAARDSRPLIVLGMHRSGTSVVTEVLHAMGSYAGEPDQLPPPDIFNPTGYWEHNEAARIDRDILRSLGASWSNVVNADVSRLSDDDRAAFVARAKKVAQSMQGRGSFVLKDPRMSLVFPLWAEALGNPICVIAWREPLAVAQSLATRDKPPLIFSLAAWEHYNRTLLRDTQGLPRLLVSYEELLADPVRVVGDLREALVQFGVEGLQALSEERIRQSVNADFNRSARNARTDATLLDPEQRALLADLRSGAALRNPVAPSSARTMELLAAFAEFAKERNTSEQLRQEIAELDLLLSGVFQSNSWRLGHGLLNLLRRGNAISARDRWEEQKRQRYSRT